MRGLGQHFADAEKPSHRVAAQQEPLSGKQAQRPDETVERRDGKAERHGSLRWSGRAGVETQHRLKPVIPR